MSNYYERRLEAKYDAWEEFLGSKEWRDDVEDKLRELCKNPDAVAEAIGPDGLKYPFPTTAFYSNGSAERLREINARMREHEDTEYGLIGAAIMAGDHFRLGQLIMRHARKHLTEIAEDRVEEKWSKNYDESC